MELTETTLSSKRVYEGRIVNVRMDTAALPDGKQVYREVVEHPGGVAVFALVENDEVVMVRQFRYPFGEVLLEIPAGKLEPGEDPELCAKRELSEETGYEAEKLIFLGIVYASPGVYAERLHLYLALSPQRHEAHPDVDERLLIEHIPLSDLKEKIHKGECKDAKTLAATLLAELHLTRQAP